MFLRGDCLARRFGGSVPWAGCAVKWFFPDWSTLEANSREMRGQPMKRSALAFAMILMTGSAMSAAGQAATEARSASKSATMSSSSVQSKSTLRCTGADGKTACTAEQARDVATGLATGKRMHKPYLVDVESVTLGQNGTLDCKQTNGSVCTHEQLSAVMDFTMSTHSHGGKSDLHVTWTVDTAGPTI